MKRKLVYGIIGIILIIAAIAMVINPPKSGYYVKNVEEEEIKIGLTTALSGPAADYAVQLKKASEIAAKEINSRGGIKGKKLRIIYEDSKGSPKGAVSSARKLINVDGVRIIISGLSAETLAIAPLANENRVLLLTTAWSPKISAAGDYVFRFGKSAVSTASAHAVYIKESQFERIGVLYSQSEYGESYLKKFKEVLNDSDINIVAQESYFPEEKDIRTQITKIKNKKPDAVILICDGPEEVLRTTKQMKQMNVQLPVVGDETVCNTPLGGYEVKYENLTCAMIKSSDTEEFKEKFREHSGEYPMIPMWESAAYDSIHLIKEGVEKKGYDIEAIKKFFYNIKKYKGSSGEITIDSKGDRMIREIGIFRLEEGTLIEVGS